MKSQAYPLRPWQPSALTLMSMTEIDPEASRMGFVVNDYRILHSLNRHTRVRLVYLSAHTLCRNVSANSARPLDCLDAQVLEDPYKGGALESPLPEPQKCLASRQKSPRPPQEA